jgi:hypothetical protein
MRNRCTSVFVLVEIDPSFDAGVIERRVAEREDGLDHSPGRDDAHDSGRQKHPLLGTVKVRGLDHTEDHREQTGDRRADQQQVCRRPMGIFSGRERLGLGGIEAQNDEPAHNAQIDAALAQPRSGTVCQGSRNAATTAAAPPVAGATTNRRLEAAAAAPAKITRSEPSVTATSYPLHPLAATRGEIRRSAAMEKNPGGVRVDHPAIRSWTKDYFDRSVLLLLKDLVAADTVPVGCGPGARDGVIWLMVDGGLSRTSLTHLIAVSVET